jgi:hypothetical protein
MECVLTYHFDKSQTYHSSSPNGEVEYSLYYQRSSCTQSPSSAVKLVCCSSYRMQITQEHQASLPEHLSCRYDHAKELTAKLGYLISSISAIYESVRSHKCRSVRCHKRDVIINQVPIRLKPLCLDSRGCRS